MHFLRLLLFDREVSYLIKTIPRTVFLSLSSQDVHFYLEFVNYFYSPDSKMWSTFTISFYSTSQPWKSSYNLPQTSILHSFSPYTNYLFSVRWRSNHFQFRGYKLDIILILAHHIFHACSIYFSCVHTLNCCRHWLLQLTFDCIAYTTQWT
jgi:hypothetical protein